MFTAGYAQIFHKCENITASPSHDGTAAFLATAGTQ
jgi:hypothetical protein